MPILVINRIIVKQNLVPNKVDLDQSHHTLIGDLGKII